MNPRLCALFVPLLLGCTDPGGSTPPDDGPTPGVQPDGSYLAPDLIDAGAPRNARQGFSGPAGGVLPQLTYPLDGAMLARNSAQMELAWRADPAQRLFRLVIAGPRFRRTFYLGPDGCGAGRCSYHVKDADWAQLALALAMPGGSATLTLSGTAGSGRPVATAPSLSLSFSPEDVRGGLYYFAASASGLYRLPFGASKALPFAGSRQQGCVGCHAVSADGKKVAAVFDGGDGFAGILDARTPGQYVLKPVRQVPDGNLWNFASFNPDGTRLVTVWRGEMALRDGQTGALIKQVGADLLGGRASMPEWSPDGASIVFVRIAAPEGKLGADLGLQSPNPAGDWILGDAGDIALVPYHDGDFGPALTIVPRSPGMEYHFYPTFSPDSQWIAFNSALKASCASPSAAANGVRVAGLCMSYDQRAARLRLVRAVEGAGPLELRAATQKEGMTTAWPRFTPFQQGGLTFLTFSAKFAYGWVVPADDHPQVWMAGVDLRKAQASKGQEVAVDPSYAPFWLPFQDSTTNNHAAIWTREVACSTSAECGDEFVCTGGSCVPAVR